MVIYQVPRLVDFNIRGMISGADCPDTGSSASGSCINIGLYASGGCASGNSPVGSCSAGGGRAVECLTGSSGYAE